MGLFKLVFFFWLYPLEVLEKEAKVRTFILLNFHKEVMNLT